MAAVKIRELPEEDRPREKLLQRGASALTDRELLAILLRTGVKGANAVEVGGQLLQKHKTLSGLCRCGAEELVTIHGIGPAKAVQLAPAVRSRRVTANQAARSCDHRSAGGWARGVFQLQRSRRALMIHLTAIIGSGAKIGANVEIGPHTLIGGDVTIGNETMVGANAVIEGKVTIG